MWIQVRSMDGKKLVRIDGLSKLTKIEELREQLVEPFDASSDRQRLFFRGKQLEDGHNLFEYDVGLNAIIQILVRVPPPGATSATGKSEPQVEKRNNDPSDTEENDPEPEAGSSLMESQDSGFEDAKSTYKLGDIIDARDETMGAWFEANIMKISRNAKAKNAQTTTSESATQQTTEQSEGGGEVSTIMDDKQEPNTDQNSNIKGDQATDVEMTNVDGSTENDTPTPEPKNNNDTSDTTLPSTEEDAPAKYWGDEIEDDAFEYHLKFEGYEDDDIVKSLVKHMRPRSRHKVSLDEVQAGDRVMVNYNYDEPDSRGYWYDALVVSKRNTRTIKEVIATVYIGKDLVPFENCKVLFTDEIFRIEKAGCQLNAQEPGVSSPTKRQNKAECDHCLDNPRRKCKHCACSICGDKREPDKQVLCDECDQAYHLYCLDPPLAEVPDVDEWYCPQCKNDASEVVLAGEKLKSSKKKSKMASATSTAKRDWGKGMACMGRNKECTIVSKNYIGPIPGIAVGTLWKFRVQVSEAGVHRPHVAGIHGREEDGAFSIVLSGGYEDDKDDGDQFTYTGSGGRDLSGNKRTAEQSCDQILTRTNMALAKNCNASVDKKKGAEAIDWKAGRPVRVVRNCKGAKHSKYAPEEGNRYDGIYKIQKYWPEKGKSGFIVWRYLFRRDDPNAAPWTKEGRRKIKEAGLTMQYPEGYLEKEIEKQKQKEEEEAEETPGKGKGRGRKRKRADSNSEEENEEAASPNKSPAKKKRKSVGSGYKVEAGIFKQIREDAKNAKTWNEALKYMKEGSQTFLAHVEELFACICCQDIVMKPITTVCLHNICKPCLRRSFKADVYNCPACRADLPKDCKMDVNKTLSDILNGLFPGYENGRL